ncbi:class F sortase [Streptomyces drozdowiczii]|uniref:Class F sortase n=1 Tax=Streptomyces drozdowiczii TaxID=202862 RepID=A0ABY6PN77_9ACTN|nr:class F sortase [Streptomyces drozdowiczii]MCX0247030.1 class F sortase [Streptomyces drozdowiczii]UZK53532.1 class F sortase [Streptomyces drozdowiczii]
MTLSVTSSLVAGIVWASSDSPDDPVAAAHGNDAAGGGDRPVSHAPLSPSRPVKVAVPAIFIEAPVTGLGLDRKGHLGAPPMSKPREVGWYRDGPSPGEKGTSLIVGHRDTETGPAIFLNLNALHKGDKVTVTRADKQKAVFTVDAVETYTKDKFPDDKVYGSTGRAELRLMTCGGRFNKKDGYAANVVVFAHLTSLKKV